MCTNVPIILCVKKNEHIHTVGTQQKEVVLHPLK